MTITASTTRHEHPRHATPADAAQVAETLAGAFSDDPVMSWCWPDPVDRQEILPRIFRVAVDACLPSGGVYTTPGHAAAAVWLPPTAEVDDEQFASDLGTACGGDTERLYTLMELMDANHPHADAHHYLLAVGTRPGWQGLGIGSRMLRAGLAHCDRDGMPAYLEATSERNRRLYERHGFTVTQEFGLPDGPSVSCMWRPA